jgi:hypothetical protein
MINAAPPERKNGDGGSHPPVFSADACYRNRDPVAWPRTGAPAQVNRRCDAGKALVAAGIYPQGIGPINDTHRTARQLRTLRTAQHACAHWLQLHDVTSVSPDQFAPETLAGFRSALSPGKRNRRTIERGRQMLVGHAPHRLADQANFESTSGRAFAPRQGLPVRRRGDGTTSGLLNLGLARGEYG